MAEHDMDPTTKVLNTIGEGIKTICANQTHLMEQFKVLNENQRAMFNRLKGMDENLSSLEGIEVDNGVDSYPFREQFERLCRDVDALKKQEAA